MKTPSSRRVHRRPDVSIAVQKFLRILLTNPTLDRPALRSSLRAWPPGRAQTHCEHVRDATADLVEVILAASATVEGLGYQPRGIGGRRRAVVAGVIVRRRRRHRLGRGTT